MTEEGRSEIISNLPIYLYHSQNHFMSCETTLSIRELDTPTMGRVLWVDIVCLKSSGEGEKKRNFYNFLGKKSKVS
jgi:hypothetical protein